MADDKSDNERQCESENKGQQPKPQPGRIASTTPTIIRFLLGGLGFGLITYGSVLLSSRNQPIRVAWGFIGFGFFFALIAARLLLINHKGKHRMPLWLPDFVLWGGVVMDIGACILGVYIYEREPIFPTAAQPPVIVLPQPDYIPGTEFTHADLERTFPFGYTVFFSEPGNRLRHEFPKNGKMDWDFDLDNVTIEPNFSTGFVKWTIPKVTAKSESGPRVNLQFNNFIVTVRLNVGMAESAGTVFGDKPVLCVATLSDNQRTPVFALGYRIPPTRGK